jgi:hypothetical protein
VSTLEEVPHEILEARRRYKDIRNHLLEIDAILRADDISLKEKLKTKSRIMRGISLISANLATDFSVAATSLSSDANEIVEVEKLADGFEVGDVAWGKIIGKLINAADGIYWRMKLRPLFATRKYYLDASRFDLSRVVSKLFGHELSPQDAQLVESYAKFASKQIKTYLGGRAA